MDSRPRRTANSIKPWYRYSVAVVASILLPYFANRQLWLIGTAACLPLVLLYVHYEQKQAAREEAARRRREMICVKCGYDLRATPDRCPECGAVPTKTS